MTSSGDVTVNRFGNVWRSIYVKSRIAGYNNDRVGVWVGMYGVY